VAADSPVTAIRPPRVRIAQKAPLFVMDVPPFPDDERAESNGQQHARKGRASGQGRFAPSSDCAALAGTAMP